MLKIITLLACLLAFFFYNVSVLAESEVPETAQVPVVSEPEVKAIKVMTQDETIDHYASLYGANATELRKVMRCESGGRQSAVGDGGLAIGVYQYHRATFTNLSKKLGEQLNIDSEHDQIKLTAWAFANGHGNNWTAYRAIKHGGTYSFYSKLLGRHFTVHCR